jgi:hypothetical protein
MTLRKAKSIARHLRLTLRQLCSGDYRVNLRDGSETTAYYTDNLEDAVNAAVEMARTRDVVQGVDETVATGRVPTRIDDLPIDLNAVRAKRRSKMMSWKFDKNFIDGMTPIKRNRKGCAFRPESNVPNAMVFVFYN